MPEERPAFKSTIHNHPVYCDDLTARTYLKNLDTDEAEVIFSHAKVHGRAEFEIHKNGSRYNYTMGHNDGAYIVEQEGKQQGSGWF